MLGTTLGQYEILEEIGRGGMGIVYRAREKSLAREVALKILPAELSAQPRLIKRFRREAQTVAALSHPNIVPIFAFGETESAIYYAMELIPGTNLKQHIKAHGPLQPRPALQILAQVASALAAAHEARVIHRDIKPQNIMIDRKGRVRVLDFGLAKLMNVAPSMSNSGGFVGTLAYASPEQCQGAALDGRTDLYSLGVVFHEMMTGALPYENSSSPALVREILLAPPVDIRSRLSDLPEAVARIADRLLRKKPEERFAKPEELLSAIREALTPPSRHAPLAEIPTVAPLGEPPRKTLPRVLDVLSLPHRLRPAAAANPSIRSLLPTAVVLAAAVAGGLFFLSQDNLGKIPRHATYIENLAGLDMRMVWIAGGSFLMGNGSEEEDEKPAHTVDLDGFWLGDVEVTNRQYKVFIAETGYDGTTDCANNYLAAQNDASSTLGGDNYPLQFVSWQNAKAFCDWLSRRTGRVYQMPSEAQWEFACLAGATTRYSSGNSPTDLAGYAWSGATSGGQLHPVASLKPNRWALYDMHGSVWEWCRDYYDPNYYSRSARRNPSGPETSPAAGARVLRGGAWYNSPVECLAISRLGGLPTTTAMGLGFRVCRVTDETPPSN